MFRWGDTELKVEFGKYVAPFAKRERSILALIPSIDLSAASSVVQDGGRERKVVNLNGFCLSLEEYGLLYDDYLLGTVREFEGPSGEYFDGLIYELSAPKQVNNTKFEYDLTIMEA